MNLSLEVAWMTTSQTQFFNELAAGHNGPTIPASKRAYFQARLKNRLFNFILGKFVEEQKNGLTKAALARRIGKSPEVINRLLAAPSNLTLDTASDLLLGISAEELTPASEPLLIQAPQNFLHAGWIRNDDQPGYAQPPTSKGLKDTIAGPNDQTNRTVSGRELLGAR
ncbi:MAG: helix-turn-helix transcriptional regulator [Xanthobacteraceae bacterium]